MYLAELRGKLSSVQENSEDLLTSNVFSFFKYSNRHLFLKSFLTLIDISCSPEELRSAQFEFWPTYDDNTEPDLVLQVGDHYILVEAKYFSGFGEETSLRKSQIIREIVEGLNVAESLQKRFHFVALTADYNFPKHIFLEVHDDYLPYTNWLNWQAIAHLILKQLENEKLHLRDEEFARDLYDLLSKKNLRGFLAFDRLKAKIHEVPEAIFFAAETASFRGDFIGFEQAMQDAPPVAKPSGRLFFQRRFFTELPEIELSIIEYSLGGPR